MSKIKVMSELLANKIAAGEVIEKCSSVIKELVENSLDAKASNIKINLKDAGLKEMCVIDDGVGMDEDDALLCFSRHATSKLLRDDDLFFIDTLGFRGEALPSIASVSEIEMETCQKDVGLKIHIKGGNLIKKEPSSAKKGTLIKVTNLFYNTPARLKYLKSESSELSSIVFLIEKLALSHPNVSFSLTNNDKSLLKTSGSNNLLKVIHEIYGLEISSNMIFINASNDDFTVKGYICKPSYLKTNKNDMTTFVNNRLVKNVDINRAINDAYYTYKAIDRYPIVILNIETDPTLIDVNIHPTKQDIKISKIDDLYNLIYKSVKDLLYTNLLIPKINASFDTEKNELIEKGVTQEEIKQIENNNDIFKMDYSKVNQTVMDFKEEEIVKNEKIKSLILYPVGLAHGTYIIAENDEGVYIIDQHAAQERINYEKYMKALASKDIHIKSMLIPITIELTSAEYLKFKEKEDVFKNLGFIYDDFGINTLIIKSHPDFLLEGYEEESIRKILDLIINLNKTFDRVKFEEHLAITLACKMSIKANMHISYEKQVYLLNELVKCDNPYNCPHGRPTIIKYTIYELEKLFKRAM